MSPIFILAAEFTAVMLLARWLYFHFVLPASLSKNDWYADYLQLCDFIKQIDSCSLLDSALTAFCKFSNNNKSQWQNPQFHYCVRRVVKLLKKKYSFYKNKTLVA